jgi:hypothetical protein
MTLKQQIHELVDGLPDDSPLLADVNETLRMDRAIGDAVEDIAEGRTHEAADFMAKVHQRWPRKRSA